MILLTLINSAGIAADIASFKEQVTYFISEYRIIKAWAESESQKLEQALAISGPTDDQNRIDINDLTPEALNHLNTQVFDPLNQLFQPKEGDELNLYNFIRDESYVDLTTLELIIKTWLTLSIIPTNSEKLFTIEELPPGRGCVEDEIKSIEKIVSTVDESVAPLPPALPDTVSVNVDVQVLMNWLIDLVDSVAKSSPATNKELSDKNTVRAEVKLLLDQLADSIDESKAITGESSTHEEKVREGIKTILDEVVSNAIDAAGQKSESNGEPVQLLSTDIPTTSKAPDICQSSLKDPEKDPLVLMTFSRILFFVCRSSEICDDMKKLALV